MTKAETEFTNKLNEILEENFQNESFGVSELAKEMGMSRSNLHRKIQSVYKISTSQFIRQQRLKKGMELLRETSLSVSEVSYKVGFGSPSYFIKSFHNFYGYSPGEVGIRENIEDESQIIKTKKKVTVLISSVFFLGLIVVVLFFVIKPFSVNKSSAKYTIAILPFEDNSLEGETPIINGIRDVLHSTLDKIEHFDIVNILNSNNYYNTTKSTSEIGKELRATHILTGSGNTHNGKWSLRLFLIETKTSKTIWNDIFTEDVTDNIFSVQSSIGEKITAQLNAELTPKVKQEMTSRISTDSLAFQYYLWGLSAFSQYIFESNLNWDKLHLAKSYFEKALQRDSTIAGAYLNLASIYINNYAVGTASRLDLKRQDLYLDSGFRMANLAIKYNYKEKEHMPYVLRANYYFQKGMFEKREEEILKINEFGVIESTREFWENRHMHELYNAIEAYYTLFEMGVLTEHSINELNQFTICLHQTGHYEVCKKYIGKIFELNNNHVHRLLKLTECNRYAGNFEEALKEKIELYNKDTTNGWGIWNVLIDCIYLNEFQNANIYLDKFVRLYPDSKKWLPDIFLGFLFFINGDNEFAEFHLGGAEKRYLDEIELKRPNARFYLSHFWLASIYSLKGEKEKALKYLKEIKNREFIYRDMLMNLEHLPLFDNIRSEPEFQEILADAQTKYQKEHERVGELLREFGEID